MNRRKENPPEKIRRASEQEEARSFIKFIQKLNKTEQMGVLTIIQGLEMMKGYEDKL